REYAQDDNVDESRVQTLPDATATESQHDHPPVELPPPPRSLTARARRRSWAEAPVRIWALLAALLALVAAYILVTRVAGIWYDRWLILHGTPVQAKVDSANGIHQGRVLDRREITTADLIYKTPDGAEHWAR